MKRFARENALTLAFGLLFLAVLVGEAFVGQRVFNEDQLEHGGEPIGFWRYVLSSAYGSALMENWQSEYLQFTLYILLTIWLIQRGSPESKEPGKQGRESEQEQQLGEHADERSPRWAKAEGLRRWAFSNSLLLVMGSIWIGSWVAQSITGVAEYNEERLEHQRDAVTWLSYLGTASFWEKTFQNWQSEFLAVGSMAILAVYLRQRGSPESKPVGAPHDATGVEG